MHGYGLSLDSLLNYSRFLVVVAMSSDSSKCFVLPGSLWRHLQWRIGRATGPIDDLVLCRRGSGLLFFFRYHRSSNWMSSHRRTCSLKRTDARYGVRVDKKGHRKCLKGKSGAADRESKSRQSERNETLSLRGCGSH